MTKSPFLSTGAFAPLPFDFSKSGRAGPVGRARGRRRAGGRCGGRGRHWRLGFLRIGELRTEQAAGEQGDSERLHDGHGQEW
jgi:hypothetical protein